MTAKGVTKRSFDPSRPSSVVHLATLLRRLAHAVPLDADALEVLRTGRAPVVEPTLVSLARLARRQGARSVDATLTHDALVVAMLVPDGVGLPVPRAPLLAAVQARWGRPLVLQAGDFVAMPTPTRGDDALTAIANSARRWLARMEAMELDVRWSVDPEAVHQFRIAMRRVRAHDRVLASLDREDPGETVRTWTRHTGEFASGARDLDVVLEKLAQLQMSEATREAARADLERRRALARERLAAWLTADSYRPVMLERDAHLMALAGEACGRSIDDAAAAHLAREWKGLRRQLREDITAPQGYHNVRRRLRRVRDAVSVLGRALRSSDRAAREKLRGLQVWLGDLNDLDTAEQLHIDAPHDLANALRAERVHVMAELAVPLALLAIDVERRR